MPPLPAKLRCEHCQKFFPAPILQCSRCGRKYCSKDCQRADWRTHKPICSVTEKHAAIDVAIPSLQFGVNAPTTGLGPAADKVMAEFTVWIQNIQMPVLDLFYQYLQVGTAEGFGLVATHSLYVQITPQLASRSYRDKFSLEKCFTRPHPDTIKLVLKERDKIERVLFASLIFQVDLGVVAPAVRDVPCYITIQFRITPDRVAKSLLVSNEAAWGNFKERAAQVWDAYDAAEARRE